METLMREKIFQYIKRCPTDVSPIVDYIESIRNDVEHDPGKISDRVHADNRMIRRHIQEKMILWDDMDGLAQLNKLYRTSLLLDAPVDFDSYMLYIELDRDREKRYYAPRRRIIKPLVDNMQRLMDDELDLLTISMPPGTGKSTAGIFLLTWIMGRFPDKPNLVSAHSGLLTRSFYDGVLQIIQDPEYLWSDVFKTHKIECTNSKEETIDIDRPHRFSTLTCRAINASLTGATRCEGLLYSDDLVSGIEEAMNKDRLDSLWQKYTNDLKSRKKLGAKELHIATRWSIHDPIGRLEQMYGDDPRCKFIVAPALNEKDESNFDYDYGVGFDSKYFWDMRNNLDDASWRALFQNQPIEREGQLYPENDLRRFFELPDGEPDAVLAVCDTKDRGADFCGLPIAYKYGSDYYIADVVFDNSQPEIVEPRLVEILMRHKVSICQFESNSAGGHVAAWVDEQIRSKGGTTHITKKWTSANKETKIIVNAPYIKEHFLFLDESKYKKASDYGRFIQNITGYTMMGKNKHDDAPDVLAQLSEYVQGMSMARVEPMKRPF